MSDCYHDAAGCLVCPEQPARPYVPARVQQQVVLGWNAGANSIDVVDGDLHAVFDMPLGVVGVAIGLKAGRARPTTPGLIEHGWYFQYQGGLNLCQPIERGVVLGSPSTSRTAETQFEIRRIGGQVTYLADGAVVATSSTPSHGPRLVNACLYASSDSVPSGDTAGGGGDSGGGAGDNALTSGTPVTVDFAAGGASWTTDQGWYIDVAAGASNLTFQVTPPAGDPASVAMVANFGTLPTGEYGATDTDAWSGFTYTGAAADGVSNAGATDLLLSFDAPTAGRWYVILDAVAAGDGYTLTAVVT